MNPVKLAAKMSVSELAAYIDQPVLKPEFTQAEIRQYIGGGSADRSIISTTLPETSGSPALSRHCECCNVK